MLKDKNKTENEWQYLKCHFNHDQIIYSEEKPVQVVCLQKCSEQSFQENFFVLLFRILLIFTFSFSCMIVSLAIRMRFRFVRIYVMFSCPFKFILLIWLQFLSLLHPRRHRYRTVCHHATQFQHSIYMCIHLALIEQAWNLFRIFTTANRVQKKMCTDIASLRWNSWISDVPRSWECERACRCETEFAI